jgi:hypothetical protein
MINNKALSNLDTIFGKTNVSDFTISKTDIIKNDLQQILERSKVFIGDMEYKIDCDQLYNSIYNYVKELR